MSKRVLLHSYDPDTDTLTVEGQQYSGELFRQFAFEGLLTGTLFEFTRNGDGSFAIRKVWDPAQGKAKP